MRVGTGFDAHRFAEGRPLVLGGVDVKHSQGLDGHSDADVLSHAVIDALLGATALGDIGTHYPDSDESYRDVRSLDLLEDAVNKLRVKGFEIENIDSTVIAEVPKLSGYISEMRSSLAKAVGVDISRISVKATTVEGMGALGRGEGIAAMAVAAVTEKACNE